jgi:hypothetical protein
MPKQLVAPVDEIMEWMADNGVPLTREEYIAAAFFPEIPKPWDAEYEMMLPPELQDWSLFDNVNGTLTYRGDPVG